MESPAVNKQTEMTSSSSEVESSGAVPSELNDVTTQFQHSVTLQEQGDASNEQPEKTEEDSFWLTIPEGVDWATINEIEEAKASAQSELDDITTQFQHSVSLQDHRDEYIELPEEIETEERYYVHPIPPYVPPIPPPVDIEDVLARKKLVLLVDLDHCILHTTLSPDVPRDMPNVVFYGDEIDDPCCTAFRPGLDQCLRDWKQLFDLYVCTKGTRDYAEDVLDIIDPDNEFFERRIFSRENMEPDTKLNVLYDLFPSEDPSYVIMIDDTASVWNSSDNLINVIPYVYFEESSEFYENYKDYIDTDCYLTKSLNPFLKSIHARYFELREKGNSSVDVRHVIYEKCQEILAGVTIYFGEMKNDEEESDVRSNADMMGATVVYEADESVTHIVTYHCTQEVKEAQELSHCPVYHSQWILDCMNHWRRLPEEHYMITQH